jgi:very-short-patch-repair endonuclease
MNDSKIDFFTAENKNGLRSSEKYLSENYNNIFNSVINWSAAYVNMQFKERIYLYMNHMLYKPKCLKCGNDIKFTGSFIKGYRTYCSRNCACMSDNKKMKTIETNISRYGVGCVFKSDTIIEKIKNTNIELYGVENVFSSKAIKSKIKQTVLETYGNDQYSKTADFKKKYEKAIKAKYGVSHFSKTNTFKNDFKATMTNRYGVDNPLKSAEIKEKMRVNCDKAFKARLKTKGYDVIKIDNYLITVMHPDGHIFTEDRRFLINRFNTNVELSTELLPKYHSNPESDLISFIASLTNNLLLNKRSISDGKEIDIYIPDKKVGIEFDGLYWHSNIYKDKQYHKNKTELCKNDGIQLLHVFEDEWANKKEIVKSIIRSKLGMIENRIYARKCVVKELESKDCSKFLNENHLQGNVGSAVKLGLYFNNELVSVMTFGKKRVSMGVKARLDGEFEMMRFANKLNTTVIGGAGKLLKHFIKTNNPVSILSFADRRYSNGGLYKQLGFKFIGNTEPNYFYFKKNELIREYRFKYRKDILVKNGFDPSLTEFEIMAKRGFLQIYDCGSMKFELK